MSEEGIKYVEQEKQDENQVSRLKNQRSDDEDVEHLVIAEAHATDGE